MPSFYSVLFTKQVEPRAGIAFVKASSERNAVRIGPVWCSDHTVSRVIEELKLLLFDTSIRPRSINFLNAHVYNLAACDEILRRALNESRIVTADGISMVWASRLLDKPVPERCNMTEVFRAFLQNTGIPINRCVLIGGAQEEADAAAMAIQRQSSHCRIVHAVSGYEDIGKYEELLSSSLDPDIALIGMGSPRSETAIRRLASVRPGVILWHIGGGTVQFYAGTRREAPSIIRDTGFQWLYRLLHEPRRMWKRYLVGNPVFVASILMLVLRRRRKGKRAQI